MKKTEKKCSQVIASSVKPDMSLDCADENAVDETKCDGIAEIVTNSFSSSSPSREKNNNAERKQ